MEKQIEVVWSDMGREKIRLGEEVENARVQEGGQGKPGWKGLGVI